MNHSDRCKAYYRKNRDSILEQKKNYVARNREKVFKRRKRFRKINKKRLAITMREWQMKNKGHMAEYRKRRAARFAEYNRRVKYGLPAGVFDAMRILQNNKCAICEEVRPLCVDHCHTTKKVRGLLCRKCNSCLGLIGEKVEILRMMEVYLAGFPKLQEVA